MLTNRQISVCQLRMNTFLRGGDEGGGDDEGGGGGGDDEGSGGGGGQRWFAERFLAPQRGFQVLPTSSLFLSLNPS